MAEWRYGAGVGTQHVIYMTVSTGIGGGIITGGSLLLGRDGAAGEIGHMTVDVEGPICVCGSPGHLEALASGTAIARMAREQLEAGASTTLRREGSPVTAAMSPVRPRRETGWHETSWVGRGVRWASASLPHQPL